MTPEVIIDTRLRPDLDRVAIEIFHEIQKPDLPDGWFWMLANADGILLRGHDGDTIQKWYPNTVLQPQDSDEAFVAWIGAKCLQGERKDWRRAAIGILWTKNELDATPLASLRSKLQAAVLQLHSKLEEMQYEEGGVFPSPTIV